MELNKLIENKKAFLWDFDGTLADTERWHFLAVNAAFAAIGHSVVEKDYYRYFSFLGEGIVGEIRRKELVSADLDKISEDYRKHYWQTISSGQALPFPEVPQILKAMKKLGRKIAIVSNSGEEEIGAFLKVHNIDMVDLVIGRQAHLNRKPAPDLFLHALKTLNLQPSEALILEDSEIGLRAAHAAGCEALWLRTPFNHDLSTAHKFALELSHKDLLAGLATQQN